MPTKKKTLKPSARKQLAAGELVAIPLPGNRFAMIWVLASGEDRSVSFLVMKGFWDALPTARDVSKARPAKSDDEPDLGYDDVWKGWIQGAIPADFQVVGTRAVTEKERRYAKNASGTMVFGSAKRLRDEMHRTWRLTHDKKALFSEWAAEEAAEKKRVAERRKAMTLTKLRGDRSFGREFHHWPAAAQKALQRIFRTAFDGLIALEKSGTKRERTKVVRQITTELNVLDDPRGIIESVERDRLVEHITEIAGLVGLANDNEQLTGHRDW